MLYALGVRSLAIGPSDSRAQQGRNPVGVALATICFLVVLAGVAVGMAYIVAAGKGEQLDFSHGYPTFVPKS